MAATSRRVTLVVIVVAALATGACGGMSPPVESIPATASAATTVPSSTPTRAPTAVPTAAPTGSQGPNDAALVDLPTGECALEVRHVHIPDDMHPEVATILDPPSGGAAFQVDRDFLLNGTPVAWVSAVGDGWSGFNSQSMIGPDGTQSEQPSSSRPFNQGPMNDRNVIWQRPLYEVGRHVVHLSSHDLKCEATLVFEVI
jgi:hypothetical protein